MTTNPEIVNDRSSDIVKEFYKRPLPPGTVIEYLFQRAVVVFDDGGPRIKVVCDGAYQEWFWILDGVECKVIRGSSGKWKVEAGPKTEGYYEWWEVTDGTRTFKCDKQEDANWLVAILNTHVASK